MNWYHRAERRYVEYGSSFEATRAFGLFRSLYDTVYNMNMAHLSDEVETVFETLGDHGVRTACTPFLIYRGRTRHELGLEGLLRRVALAATFRHATWGPDELFYGELYSSRQGPVQADPGAAGHPRRVLGLRRARAGRERPLRLPALLAARQRLPLAQVRARRRRSSRSRAPTPPSRELVDAAGGLDEFLDRTRGDPGRRPRADRRSSTAARRWPRRSARDWRVLQPNEADPERAELAVCPSSRAGGVYVLRSTAAPRERLHAAVRERLRELEGVDLFAWLELDGEPRDPAARRRPPARRGDRGRRARRRRASLPPRRGGPRSPRRAAGTSTATRRRSRGRARRRALRLAPTTPTRSRRLWSALHRPARRRDPDLGRARATSASTGAASPTARAAATDRSRAGDSLGPLLLCGLEPGTEAAARAVGAPRRRRAGARPLRRRRAGGPPTRRPAAGGRG